MTKEERQAGLVAWIASRPDIVQELAKEFNPGDVYTDESGCVWYHVGYEDGRKSFTPGVRVSAVDPCVDHAMAIKNAITFPVEAARLWSRQERDIT